MNYMRHTGWTLGEFDLLLLCGFRLIVGILILVLPVEQRHIADNTLYSQTFRVIPSGRSSKPGNGTQGWYSIRCESDKAR